MKTIIRFFSYLLLLASCSSSFVLSPNNVFSTRTKTSLFVIKVDSKFISQNSPQVLSVPSSSLPTQHKKRENEEDTKEEEDLVQMVSFYRFVPIDNPEEIRDAIFVALTTRKEEEKVAEGRESRSNQQILGTVYVAKEGINAQLAIPIETFDTTMKKFQEILPSIFEVNKPNCGNVVSSDTTSFKRLIVRTRNFILRDGLEECDEMNNNNKEYDWDDAGVELTPEQWHQELSQSKLQSSSFETSSPPPLLIDCRNTYESDEGRFQNSTALETNLFSESWQKLDELMEKQEYKNKDQPVYIYCTGGVRCVKTGAYLKQKLNYTNVRRLEHGIIGYQRWFEEEKTDNNGREGEGSNLWVGENFLFDRRRLAVNSTCPN